MDVKCKLPHISAHFSCSFCLITNRVYLSYSHAFKSWTQDYSSDARKSICCSMKFVMSLYNRLVVHISQLEVFSVEWLPYLSLPTSKFFNSKVVTYRTASSRLLRTLATCFKWFNTVHWAPQSAWPAFLFILLVEFLQCP